jgi:hypothetical protein
MTPIQHLSFLLHSTNYNLKLSKQQTLRCLDEKLTFASTFAKNTFKEWKKKREEKELKLKEREEEELKKKRRSWFGRFY